MELEIVARLLKITASFYEQVNFIWHGGEPLLAGLDFYKEVVQLQKEAPCKINNSIQSNLTLMTDEMADFFVENQFRVSGSYDGICNEQLRGHSKEILEGRDRIVKRGQRCGLIMVVSNRNVDCLIDSYLFFKNLGTGFSLNLYLDTKDHGKDELRLEADTTAERLQDLFDYWAHDSSGTIQISYFREIMSFVLLHRKSVCSYTSCLGRWIGVRSNGELGPCNRFFPPEYSYGNVFDYSDIGEAFASDGFSNLLKAAITRREKCKSCEIYDFCSGGCNNVALNENGVENNNGLSCRVLRKVYWHIDEFVQELLTRPIEKTKYNPLLITMLEQKESICIHDEPAQ